MSFSAIQSGRYGFEKQTTSAKKQIYGATMALPDGRVFRYVENGGTAIGEGLVVASEAPAGNHDEDLVVSTSGSAGGTTIGVTLGGTAAAKNLYAEGYLFSNLASTTPHEMYKIKSHAAIASSGSGTITIDETDGFQTAITAGTDTVGLIKSPYKDVVVAPAAVAGRFVGVTCADLEADYFGWVQVSGMASVKIDGTPAVGTLVGASSNHAGQLLAVAADTTPALARLHGKAGVDNEFHTVFLMNMH
jgi:hypothetical protein|tara:strand:- start:1502 stop:2242 length:741 start_codon:yes stop_codon:yes gene_type:complete